MSRKQGTRARTRAAAKAAGTRAAAKAAQAKVATAGARRRAGDTAAQFTPLARNARMTAAEGAFHARAWAAPRLDRAGVAVQERIAPGLAGMLRRAAQRVEPARSRKRRWPVLAAGAAILAVGSGAAAFMLNRRGHLGHPGSAAGAPAGTSSETAGDTASADVNGQVRTS
jgi:hypothetical protein